MPLPDFARETLFAPLGIANFKLVPVSLMPLGKEIVEKRRGGQFDRAADSFSR